jgi:hypothetical protein
MRNAKCEVAGVASSFSISYFAFRIFRRLVFIAVVSVTCAAPALAQGRAAKKVEETPPRSLLMPYAATLLGIAIGLAAVCMPSSRKSDVPIDEEE